MLAEAKHTCDYLIVGLQTNPAIDRPDTKNKPVQSIVERYVQLNAVKFVIMYFGFYIIVTFNNREKFVFAFYKDNISVAHFIQSVNS